VNTLNFENSIVILITLSLLYSPEGCCHIAQHHWSTCRKKTGETMVRTGAKKPYKEERKKKRKVK
jgi:hypothetical protein